jgi:hypothetical protein
MNKRVVVIGCPRSGTSLLAQLIAKAGFNIDGNGTKQLMKPNPSYNPDGYYERIDIVKTNDRLIKLINSESNFLNPPSLLEIQNFKGIPTDFQFDEIKKELLNTKGWAIKDSRLAFTLHFYELVDIVGIKITRTPEDVKKSMINHYGDLFLNDVKHGPHLVRQVDFNEYYTTINECINWQFKFIPHIEVSYEDLLKQKIQSIEDFLNCKIDKSIINIKYRNYGNL